MSLLSSLSYKEGREASGVHCGGSGEGCIFVVQLLSCVGLIVTLWKSLYGGGVALKNGTKDPSHYLNNVSVEEGVVICTRRG